MLTNHTYIKLLVLLLSYFLRDTAADITSASTINICNRDEMDKNKLLKCEKKLVVTLNIDGG